MQSKRVALWTLISLLFLTLAAVGGVVLLIFFFPIDKYEGKIQGYLNEELPVSVAFTHPHISWDRGLAVSLEQVSVQGKGDSVPKSLRISADMVTLRPSLLSLLTRELKATLLLDTPAVRLGLEQQKAEPETEDEASGKGFSVPASLSEFLAVPGGFTLSGVKVVVENGSFQLPDKAEGPPQSSGGVSGLRGVVRVTNDLSVTCKVSEANVQWAQQGETPWKLLTGLSLEVRGGIGPARGQQAESRFRQGIAYAAETRGEEIGKREGAKAGTPSTLHDILPIPAWVRIAQARVSLDNGSFVLLPSMPDTPGTERESPVRSVTGFQGSAELGEDGSLLGRISESRVSWEDQGSSSWKVRGGVSGELKARIASPQNPTGAPLAPDADAPKDGEDHAETATPLPSRLHAIIPIPEWLVTEDVQVSLNEASVLLAAPVIAASQDEADAVSQGVSFPKGVSELNGSAQFKQDGGFRCEISQGLVRWTDHQGEEPWSLGSAVACMITGRLLDEGRLQAQGNVSARDFSANFGDSPVNLPDPLELSFDVAVDEGGRVTASQLSLKGPDARASTRGEAKWEEDLQEINLQDIDVEIGRWEALAPLLPDGTELAGAFSLQAKSLSVKPSEGITPEISKGSFRTGLPPGVALEGLVARVSDGRFRFSTPEGLKADLSGVEISLEQKQGKEWDGKMEISKVDLREEPAAGAPEGDKAESDSTETTHTVRNGLPPGPAAPSETPVPRVDAVPKEPAREAHGEPAVEDASTVENTEGESAPQEEGEEERKQENRKPPVQYTGPLSVHCRWSEREENALAILVIDVSKALCRYKKLLDKPPEVPLQAGLKARLTSEKIDLEKAYLLFGEIELAAEGSLANPAEPSLEARLVSNILPLDSLAGLSPFVSEHHLKGLLEIKNLELKGEIRALKETSTLQVRIAAKDLEYNQTAIKGLYAQAVYGSEILTLNPLILHPGEGVMESTFTADFSKERQTMGKHQYYGTLKVNNVEINKIVTLAQPDYADRVYGKLDVNLACRGTGFRWETASRNLEAKARVYLKGFTLAEGGDKGISEKTEKMVAHLAGGDTAAGIDTTSVQAEEKRFLSNNNVSAILSLNQEILSTNNLAATYEGKVVEAKGEMDFNGRIRVEEGKIFFRNRMVPFRLTCRIGKETCLPSPDFKTMSLSAAKEVFGGLRTLSSGARDVFKDVLF